MKRLLSLLVFLLSFSFASRAQLMQYVIGGPGNETAIRVKYLPSDQSTIIAGYSYDYTAGTMSNCQCILMKVMHGGVIAWQKTFGVAARNNMVYDMIITADENIVVVGTVNGSGAVYSDNTAAILKFNSSDGSLMWQTCFRDAATTTGGEKFFAVTELGDGTHRLVAIGMHNVDPYGSGGMICVFNPDGTMAYNQVLDIPGQGDDMYSVATSSDGASVFICGVATGNYKDGRILSYTPGTSTGTVNWTKYFDFSLLGTLNNNKFNAVQVSGHKLIINGGCIYAYSETDGLGQFVMTMNDDGTGAQIKGVQISGSGYANASRITVIDSNHIVTIQSPGSSYYDPTLWTSGASSTSVITDITSLSSGTTRTPVRLKSADAGLHSFLDVDYKVGLLHLAGSTTVTSGFGANDIYYVASGMDLVSINRDCDTAHETIAMTPTPFTNPSFSVSPFSFTPTYTHVDTATSHFTIRQLCGDLDLPTRVNTLAGSSFQVIPNPMMDEATIKSPEVITSLRVLNTVGQEVYKGACNGYEATINTASFPAGLYYIIVNNTQAQRIIKQ